MREHTTATPGTEDMVPTAPPKHLPAAGALEAFRLPSPSQAPKASWDMAQLRLPQDYTSGSQETLQATVPVGKPSPQTFFGTHPTWEVYVATLSHEDSLYLVSAGLHDALEGDLRIKLIVPYISRDGDVGLWPLGQLQTTGRSDTWTASAHRVLAASRQGWVRMRSNMRLRGYDLIKPKAAWDEPVWPNQEFDELLKSAFADKVITTLDHPVVRALHGEA